MSPGPILCVGDIDMDLVVSVPRLPGTDEKVSGRRVALTPGGMAANVAVGLARLGTPVRMLGAVGDDEAGETAVTALRDAGVEVSHVVRVANEATFMCVILIEPSGEKSLVRLESPAYLPRPADLTEAAFAGIRHVHTTHGDPALAEAALEAAKVVGATVSLDLEAADLPEAPDGLRRLLGRIDLLFVSRRSREAAEALLGPLRGTTEAMIVTTLGAEGARAEGGGATAEVAGLPAAPTDTSGAGDAFAAAFLSRWLEEAPPAEALAFANAAAALSTRAFGAQAGLPTEAEVRAALTDPTDA